MLLESRKLIFALTVTLIALTVRVSAQSGAGIRFIATPFSPDAVAFTEASAARYTGPYSGFTNPSLQAFAPTGEAMVAQNIWPGMQSTANFGAVLKQKNSTWGFSLLSNLIDGLEARTVPGPSEGTFSARYTAVATSYARRWNSFAIGVSGVLLNESIYEANAGGWSLNAGISARLLDGRVNAGSAVLHAGRMNPLRQVRTPLPSRWQTGVWADAIEFTAAETGFFAMLLSLKADVIVPLDNTNRNVWPRETDPFASLGAEFQLDERFFLRGGWRSDPTNRPWAAGAGIKLGTIKADYALTRQFDGFGSIHSISVTYSF